MKRTRRVKKTRLPVPRAISRAYPEIRSCEDSQKYVTVTVSKQDCAAGKEKDSQHCAMARALKREHKVEAIVGPTYSYIIDIERKRAIRFQTPLSVKQEIVSFDRHHDFEPGSYHLSPVSPTRRLGNHSPSPRADSRARHDTAPRHVHRTARVRQLPGGYDSE